MTIFSPPILHVISGFSSTENKSKTNPTIYHVPHRFIQLF